MSRLSRRVRGGMIVLWWLAGAWMAPGWSAAADMDFFDDQVSIPDSERFRESDYLESQVGLSFGVDKRLSYDTGRYAEAVQRFEQAIAGYRYKAEIWVFLARAHFYTNTPDEARRTLERAAAVMPDLREAVWDPMMESLLQEIRRRADRKRTELEFYMRGPDNLLSLFRMYTFLPDYDAAAEVIRMAEDRGLKLYTLAGMESAGRAKACRQDGTRWLELADQLRGELEASGKAVPPFPEDGVADSLRTHGAWPAEIRVLQRKIDYYPATAADYRRLYDLYQSVGKPDQAGRVVESLAREVARMERELETAGNGQEAQELAAAHGEMRGVLEALRGRGRQP